MNEPRCRDCEAPLAYAGRGRPPERCRDCKAARHRAHYAANREQIAARKRAYREANREQIAERDRAYREATLTCAECGERLRHRAEDGLCGFCREERELAA